MENPRVSIITASYNGERFIERAIKSVLWQTYQNWELIIVDDGSTDKTKQIVEEYSKKDSRIKLICLFQNNCGPAIPRTIACKEAKGEFIAFLDQDDIFYPECLEERVKFFDSHPGIDVVFTLAWTFDEETKKIINYEHGGPVNMMVRKKVIIEGKYFDPEQNGVDEIGMLYRYFLKDPNNINKIVLMKKEPITLYSRHPTQGSYVENKNPLSFVKRINALLSEFSEEKLKAINIKSKLFFEIKNIRSIWNSRLGNFYALAGDFKNARQAFIFSLKEKFNFFSLFFLILTFINQKIYRKLEFFLRQIQRKFLWRLKVLYYKIKFRESYNKALVVLQQYKQ